MQVFGCCFQSPWGVVMHRLELQHATEAGKFDKV